MSTLELHVLHLSYFSPPQGGGHSAHASRVSGVASALPWRGERPRLVCLLGPSAPPGEGGAVRAAAVMMHGQVRLGAG